MSAMFRSRRLRSAVARDGAPGCRHRFGPNDIGVFVSEHDGVDHANRDRMTRPEQVQHDHLARVAVREVITNRVAMTMAFALSWRSRTDPRCGVVVRGQRIAEEHP